MLKIYIQYFSMIVTKAAWFYDCTRQWQVQLSSGHAGTDGNVNL